MNKTGQGTERLEEGRMSILHAKSGEHESWLNPSNFFLAILSAGLLLLVAIGIYWSIIPHHG